MNNPLFACSFGIMWGLVMVIAIKAPYGGIPATQAGMRCDVMGCQVVKVVAKPGT